jgi:hypothetical protein
MLANKEIWENVIKSFNVYHYDVLDVKVGDTYYLFNLGEHSVIHFRIKGCKRWLFGLWITDIGDNKTRLSLFGEHEDYIDKFKPTATKLSVEVEVSNDIGAVDLLSEINDLVWDLIYDKVDVIYNSNLGGKIKFYYHGGYNRGVLKWLFNQWWFYRIEHPFREWLKYDANKYIACLICFILNLRYSKRLKATYSKTEFFSPTYEVEIKYKEGTDDDDIYDVYKYINSYCGFDKSIFIEHIPFGEKRGICFREKSNDED